MSTPTAHNATPKARVHETLSDLSLIFAASLAAVFATPSHADFGRLFFTAEERRTLDQPAPAVPPQPAPAAAYEATPAPAPPQRIDGFVRHSSGETTVWLDGAPGPLPPGLRAAPYPALELIPHHRPQDRLRAGDVWQAPAGAALASAAAAQPLPLTGAAE